MDVKNVGALFFRNASSQFFSLNEEVLLVDAAYRVHGFEDLA